MRQQQRGLLTAVRRWPTLPSQRKENLPLQRHGFRYPGPRPGPTMSISTRGCQSSFVTTAVPTTTATPTIQSQKRMICSETRQTGVGAFSRFSAHPGPSAQSHNLPRSLSSAIPPLASSSNQANSNHYHTLRRTLSSFVDSPVAGCGGRAGSTPLLLLPSSNATTVNTRSTLLPRGWIKLSGGRAQSTSAATAQLRSPTSSTPSSTSFPTRLFGTQAYVSFHTNTNASPVILLLRRQAQLLRRQAQLPRLSARSFHTSHNARFKMPGGASSTAPEYDEGAKKAAQNVWRDSKRLLSLARPEAKMLSLGVALLIVSSGISMTVPFAMGKIIDIVTHSQESLEAFGLTLPQMFLGLAGVFVMGSLANAGRMFIMRVSGERIVVRLRQQLFDSIIKQEIAFFDTNKTGDLISRLSLDTNVVGKSLTFNIADGLRSVIMATSGVTMMTYVSPHLTAIMMAIVPPVAIGAVYYGRYVKNLSKQTQEALGEITKVAEERIGNIRTVRAFAKEDDELQRYSLRVQDVFALAKKEAFASASFFSMAGFSGNMTILAILYSGGSMVMDGSLSVGELTSHLMYTLYVGSSLAGLTSFYSEIMKGIGAGSRLFDLLDKKPSIPLTGGKKLDKLTGEIKFDNVVFTYPTRRTTPIFDAISFNIQAGEVVAICGQSGIGKSTCGSLLLRFYDPDSGRILINGDTDLRDVDVRWWRNQVGLVSQEPVLFGGTIFENITYGVPDATMAQVEEVAAKANCGFIYDFPDKFETMVGERGISLSGGQKQRISIARALLKNPQILVLDEATSALDSHSEQLVQEAGKVAETGTYDELMRSEKGVFRELMKKRDL
ncbi:ATP-binding cassette permease mdl1 [Actinomortierella wolfii]|nr:ATP-binding cassette permease mdl1 [Actinomortierella wolfii]